MSQTWTKWTQDALEQHAVVPSAAPDDPSYTILYNWTTEPVNWCPRGAMDRIRSAEDPKTEYIKIVRETVQKAATWDDAPDDLPEWYGTPAHIAGEAYALSSRLVKGTIHEVTAEEHIDALGYTVLSTDEALAAGNYEDVTEMENDDVDFITADETTWQVKSSEPETCDAEKLVIVSGDDVEVRDA